MAVGAVVARILTQYSDKGSKAATKDINKLGKNIDGFVAMHICDNPSCCNPSHLVIGTHADNQTDKYKKNRQKKTQVLPVKAALFWALFVLMQDVSSPYGALSHNIAMRP